MHQFLQGVTFPVLQILDVRGLQDEARRVGAHLDQVASPFVFGKRGPDGAGDAQMILVHDRRHGARYGSQHVDCRVMVPFGQGA